MPAAAAPAEPVRAQGFFCSSLCFWKIVVLVSGCAAFALYASSELYAFGGDVKKYVLAAYIISWAISLLIFFARITGLSVHMNSECLSFNSFDYFWSWLSCCNFLSASVILACYFGCYDNFPCPSGSFCSCAQQLAGLLVGVLTAVLYVFEAQNLRLYAPLGSAYGTTWNGIWKMFILVVGGAAFGLLVSTGIVCRRGAKEGCYEARTFTLISWCVAWSMSALIYLIYICGVRRKTTVNQQLCCSSFEFFWSAFSCLLYLLGASVLAGFLDCPNGVTRSSSCTIRLAADICGFVTGVLFGIDAYLLRTHIPTWFGRRPAPAGRQTAPKTVHTVKT